MSKPIQEPEWTYRITNTGPIVDAGPDDAVCMVYYPGGHRVSSFAESEAEALRRVKLLAAAQDMARALEPLARFVEAFDAKPVRGIGDVLYGIHGGDGASEHGADIRMSDLRKAVAALKKAGVM